MRFSLVVAAVSCALQLLVSGCQSSPNFTNTTEASTVAGVALQGRVHGGNQPITGAKVYLYAVGTGGYGTTSSSLLNSPGYVNTDGNGNFTISSDYTCTTNAQVYIYAVDGNPGLAAGTNNTAAGLLAGLGPCSTLLSEGSSFPFIVVNEVSTIATAYALAGYATSATEISSSGSTLALKGVANAMATIPNLETLNTGVALAATPAGNGTVQQSTINTLANILAACINTTGSTAARQPCSTLFNNALSGGTTGTAPTNTATAAINIAHNPGVNVANLFTLQTASPPFLPDWSSARNDFTIAINYTGGGLDNPWDVVVDGSGNVWLGNEDTPGSASEFSPLGVPVTGSPFSGGGINDPVSLAIDGSGNVWMANLSSGAAGTISEFDPTTGTWPSGTSGFSGGGLSYPSGLAIDQSGNVWAANEGSINSDGEGTGPFSLSKFSSGGSPVSGSPFTGNNQLVEPAGVAIDVSGNVWVVSMAWDTPSESSISKFNSSGGAISTTPYAGGGLYQPEYVAIDASGNAWISDQDFSGYPGNTLINGGLSEFSSSGSALSGTSGFTGGGLYQPQGIAIDGGGNLWAANSDGNSLSEFNSAGTPITGANGYGGVDNTFFAGVAMLAIDGSGNIWLTLGENGPPAGNVLTEVIGLAAPVVTPTVANLLSPYGAHAVNKP